MVAEGEGETTNHAIEVTDRAVEQGEFRKVESNSCDSPPSLVRVSLVSSWRVGFLWMRPLNALVRAMVLLLLLLLSFFFFFLFLFPFLFLFLLFLFLSLSLSLWLLFVVVVVVGGGGGGGGDKNSRPT